ncbi:MAG: hypothetical protein J2O39_10685 [Acidimicrobiales bacterium]|nr:hypothetical protein [Acidimicrobiales bacterium]
MLYGFGFERTCVVASDLYFLDGEQKPGQEGAEHGVRLEVRMLDRGELKGSVYSAQPISVGLPIWRADLLETVAGPPGSFDRTHHHPRFDGWEPGGRCFVRDLSADPLGWVGAKLADLEDLLEEAGIADRAAIAEADGDQLRLAVPDIVDVVGRLLERVRAGELAQPPGPAPLVRARTGWL